MAGARAAPVAVSVVAHAGVFALLVWGLSRPAQPPPERIMQVELTPPPWRGRDAAAPEPRPAGRSTAAPVRPHATPQSPAAPPPAAVAETAGPERVRQALRGLVGCERADFLGLGEAERERCRERLAAGVDAAPKLALKRAGDFRTEDVPYLNRKPKNGCKPGIGGSEPIMGKSGVTGGIGCAWSF